MTTVKMKMTAFSVSQMGLFSELRCGDMTLFTVEPPWDTNNRLDQCIPAGVYDVVRIQQDNGPDDWLLLDVPGRAAIQIMPGNLRAQTDGNILMGSELGAIDGVWAVGNQQQAADFFDRALLDIDQFRLYVDRSIIDQNLNNNVR